jgi:hypothetical protein
VKKRERESITVVDNMEKDDSLKKWEDASDREMKARPEDRAKRILKVLAMPRTVSIMRYMHMNGWFPADRLCDNLKIGKRELLAYMDSMEEVGLVECRTCAYPSNGKEVTGPTDGEFRLRKEIPDINLAKLATDDGPFLKGVKFYSNLLFKALERAKELDEGLAQTLAGQVFVTNGWGDQKAKAVLSCFDPTGGPASTYNNFRRMVAEGVLDDNDLPVLKKVVLAMMVVLISNLETKADRTVSRLIIRVASMEILEEFEEEVEEFGLLESLPSDYFRQVQV